VATERVKERRRWENERGERVRKQTTADHPLFHKHHLS
jgi:hypothetical protein